MNRARESHQLFTPANFAWLLLYLLTMIAVVVLFQQAWDRWIPNLSTPEAQADWDEFRTEMKRVSDDPKSPVARRMPEVEEPPALALLRDYYTTCLLFALLLCSALFATFMVMVRGALGSTKFTPRAD